MTFEALCSDYRFGQPTPDSSGNRMPGTAFDYRASGIKIFMMRNNQFLLGIEIGPESIEYRIGNRVDFRESTIMS